MVVLVAAALVSGVRRDPWDPDETRYLQVTRELLAGDTPFLLTFNGEPYSHKPPLFFWLLAPFVALAGPTSAAAGAVPSILALLALAFLVPRLGRTAGLSPQVAQWGGLICLTAFLPAILAGACRMDLLLVVWTTLALDRLAALADPRSLTTRRDHLLLWLWIGLGVLTKGPIALALPLLAAAAALPFDGRALRLAVRGPGPLIAVGLVGAWLAPAAVAGGREWLETVLIHQTADRMVASFAHRRPWWYHLATIPGTLLPWTLVAGAGLVSALRRLRALAPGFRLVVLFPLTTVVLLSAVSGKTVLYPLPLFPAACLAASWWLDQGRDRRDRQLALALTAIGLATVGVALTLVAPRSPRVEVGQLAAIFAGACFALPALATAAALWRRRVVAAVLALVLVAPAFTAVGFQALLPAFDRYLSLRPFGELWARLAPPAQHQIAVYRGAQPGYSLFSGRTTRELATPSEVEAVLDTGRLVVVQRKHLSELEAALGRSLPILGGVRYRNAEVLVVSR